MCAVAGLDAPEGRELLISMLADRLPELGNIRHHGRTRLDLLEIVRACVREPIGLPVLRTVLHAYSPGSVTVLRISALIDAFPVLAVLPEPELRQVHSLLGRAGRLDVGALLRAAAGDLTPLPDRAVFTLAEAFDFLSGVNARADGLLPVMALVEHVVAVLDESAAHRPVAEDLRDWNDAQAVGLGLTSQLKALRKEIAQGAVATPAPACLVIQLNRYGTAPDRYLLSHWRQLRPGTWRPERGEDQIVALGEVEATVERLVSRAETDWGGRPGSPVLEFVLPMDLLNRPMEWLSTDSQSASATALCLSYPVVLRSLERMRAQRYHRRWHNRWQQMMADAGIACHWDTTGRRGHDPVQWNNTLNADERLVSVALNGPPLPGPEGSLECLAAALQAGVPLAVWDRRVPAPGDFRRRVKRLMRGRPAELPQRVQRLRNEAATASAAHRDSHAGRHLAVLFDDPNRIVDWSEDYEGDS